MKTGISTLKLFIWDIIEHLLKALSYEMNSNRTKIYSHSQNIWD